MTEPHHVTTVARTWEIHIVQRWHTLEAELFSSRPTSYLSSNKQHAASNSTHINFSLVGLYAGKTQPIRTVENYPTLFFFTTSITCLLLLQNTSQALWGSNFPSVFPSVGIKLKISWATVGSYFPTENKQVHQQVKLAGAWNVNHLWACSQCWKARIQDQ